MTTSTALSIPRLSSIALAPAETFLQPSLKIAWANTVAVVVPSPATSLVLLATSFNNCAPIFSYGSFSSISLATVTPSFVIVGAPNFLSRTALRPLGPNVTFTALASLSTPFLSLVRASLSNSINFEAIVFISLFYFQISFDLLIINLNQRLISLRLKQSQRCHSLSLLNILRLQ